MSKDALKFLKEFENFKHDFKDPDPFYALFTDPSVPIDKATKAALLIGIRSRSRQFLLPLIRPLARLCIVLIQILKIFIPNILSSTKILHITIYWGLRIFVSPTANYLILRHFFIGSEVLTFIKDNIDQFEPKTDSLKPSKLKDLQDNMFLIHDLNLFNFVIQVGEHFEKEKKSMKPPQILNFDSITDDYFDIEDMPNGLFNILDLESAIEIYTPLYQLLLTDNDFWRSTNSLQLDETIGIYISKILGDSKNMWIVNNKHPLIPLITMRAGFRLMLHGLSSESLHFYLRTLKREQESVS